MSKSRKAKNVSEKELTGRQQRNRQGLFALACCVRFPKPGFDAAIGDVAKVVGDMQAGMHARIAGYLCLYRRARIADRWPTPRTHTAEQCLSVANCATAADECGGSYCPRTTANREAHSDRSRRRPLARTSLNDCGPIALATAGGQVVRPKKSGGLRFSQWFFGSYGSRHKTPRVVARAAR